MTSNEKYGLWGETGKGAAKIALRGVSAKMRVVDNTCRTTIEQHYVNTEDVPIEAVYSFPLPLDATVCAFKVTDAELEMTGVVKDRDAAFEDYDAALSENRSAYLLDQDTANHFTCSVGNLAPGQDVVVSLSYVQLLQKRDNSYRVSLPTVIAEVYTPAGVAAAMDPSELDRLYPPRSLAKLPYGLELSASVRMAGGVRSVDSPSHPLKTEIDSDAVRVSFSSGKVALDREFVVNIAVAPEQSGLAVAYPDPVAGGYIAIAEFLPRLPAVEGQPKDIVFLIDCSGSMRGESIAGAKSALQLLLSSMKEGDRFNVIAFGSGFKTLFDQLTVYGANSLKEARRWVDQLDADLGGTEVLAPLTRAVEADPDARKNIVLLTDGDVGNVQQILDNILAAPACPRIFTIGIGARTDEELLGSLARATGGGVEMAYPGERLEPVVARHFARMGFPPPSGISLDWGGVEETLDERGVCLIPGETACFLRHFDQLPRGKVRLAVSYDQGEPVIAGELALAEAKGEESCAPQLYAKYQLGLQSRRSGGSRQIRASGRDKAAAIALRYGILSEFTSFVVVDPREKEPSRVGIQLRRVPVAPTLSRGMAAPDIRQLFQDLNVMRCIPARHPFGSPLARMAQAARNILPSAEDRAVNAVVRSQTAAGAWEKRGLLGKIGADESRFGELAGLLAKEQGPSLAESLALTLVLCRYLDTLLRRGRIELQPVISKAQGWLKSFNVDPGNHQEILADILSKL